MACRLVPGGATAANGNDDRFCLSQARRAGGGVSAIRLHGSDTACPPGFTLGQNGFSCGCQRHCGQCEPRDAQSGLGRQDLCLPTAPGVGPGFRPLSDRCPVGFVRVSADSPGAMGVSFAGVTGGGRINCLPVTTPRRAGELGLQSAGGCPAGSIAVEDDNPASIGHRATVESQRTGQTAQAGHEYCLPARNGLGRGFPSSAAACPAGFVRVTADNPASVELVRAAPEAAGIGELPADRQSRTGQASQLQAGTNGCPANTVAVEDDNPTAVADSDTSPNGGRSNDAGARSNGGSLGRGAALGGGGAFGGGGAPVAVALGGGGAAGGGARGGGGAAAWRRRCRC